MRRLPFLWAYRRRVVHTLKVIREQLRDSCYPGCLSNPKAFTSAFLDEFVTIVSTVRD